MLEKFKEKKIRFLIFTKYSKNGASSRIRSFQYIPFFRKKGIEVDVQTLFNSQYLKELYSISSVSKVNILRCYIRRLYFLTKIFEYDLLIIEKELFPYFSSITERLMKILAIKYVVDFDDAIFHNYDNNNNWLIRSILGKKIDVIMNKATLVTCGNDYLKTKAQKTKAKDIYLLPTVVDMTRYNLNLSKSNKKFIIGWIGSPSTMKYLEGLKKVFIDLNKFIDFELYIIGGYSIGLNEIEKIIEWKEETEVEELNKIDIGIMPLSNDIWEKGKCGYKLIQYMALGKPTVASPVGVNNKIVSHGNTGYLAINNSEWLKYIKLLALNESKRYSMGKKARLFINDNYTIQAVVDKYINKLFSIVKDK